MKKSGFVLFIALFLGFSANIFAQAPQKFNYQTVVRDNAGNLLTNQLVSFRISIREGSLGGTVVYQETHSFTTNAFGLATLQIGAGAPLYDPFTSINWGSGDKYMEVEIDPEGGVDYTSMGISQLLSVPYALYAEASGTPGITGPTGAAGAQGPTGADGVQGPTGADGALNAWSLTGNVGTDAAVNYVGTADGQDLIFKTNDIEQMRITNLGNVGIGTTVPAEKLSVSGNIDAGGYVNIGVATGTAPLTVASTTNVGNLNADLLDGYHADNTSGNIPVSNGTVNTNLNADKVDGTHQAANSEWIQFGSSWTSVLHTFFSGVFEVIGTTGRVQLRCTNSSYGIKWVSYQNGVRSSGVLNNNGDVIYWDLTGGNDDLKVILTPKYNDMNIGIIELHQPNGEWMCGIIHDTYSGD